MGHIELTLKRLPGESMGDFYDRLKIKARSLKAKALKESGRRFLVWARSPEWIEHPAENTLTLRWPYSKS